MASGNIGTEVSRGEYDYNYAGMRIRHLGSERGDIEYIYDDQSIIDEVLNSSTTQVAHYRYGDRLLSLATDAGEQFYHYASLGTTANLSNSNGENQIAYRVDPFGDITHQEGESENRQVFTGQEHDEKTGLIYFGARFYDPDSARFINQDTYLGENGTPPSLHRYLYVYSNPTVYIDPDGHAAYLASGQEFDDYGAKLYAEGNKVGAAGVAIGGAFYKVGTGFFSLGLFDEGNQAITDNDTASGAAKQFGSSVANTAKDVAKEYVEEGVVAGTAGVAGKFACGRMRQACDVAIDTGKKVYDKLNTDIGKAKQKTDPSLTSERSNLENGSGQKTSDIGNSTAAQSQSVNSEKVVSGHGIDLGDDFVVPKGAEVVTYTPRGAKLHDSTAHIIEEGGDTSKLYKNVYKEGDSAPNVRVSAIEDHRVKGNPTRVDEETPLSELVKEGDGTCHVATCLENPYSQNSHISARPQGLLDKKEGVILDTDPPNEL